MIITSLLGGMGNQMFQYALGKHLAMLNNTRLKIDNGILLDRRPGLHDVDRKYNLDIFKSNIEFTTKYETIFFNPHPFGLPGKIIYHTQIKIFGDRRIKEKYFHFDPEILKIRKPVIYLYGLWQSYKYFEGISDIIRKEFQLKIPFDQQSTIVNRILNSISVCIHIRRADYLNEKINRHIGFVGIDYYERAYSYIKKEIKIPEFFIFSDDIEWCKLNFDFIKEPKYFVSNFYSKNANNDFQLMQLCKHFIISNSSFSWWAAWLNSIKEKIVIAPDKWFKDSSINTTDLIPENWHRL